MSERLIQGGTRPKFLDCTFRDGGYYTNWDFDRRVTAAYLEGISLLPIETVEIGYLNGPREGYYGQYYFLSTPMVERIRELLAPKQRLSVMIDAKSHRPEKLASIVSGMSGKVDLVRIAVAPTDLSHGLALATRLCELGFDVGVNVMHLSRFSGDETRLAELAMFTGVASIVALVDSFGACEPHEVRSAVQRLRELLPETAIGFHGHDNLGLAFANSLAAIDAGASVIDGTISGMGRGAGNTRMEMLLIREAARSDSPLNFDALTSVVDTFEDLRNRYRWGTNLPYMISGASDLPQGDVMNWVGKNRYSVVSIVRALHGEGVGALDTRNFEPLAREADLSSASEVLIVGGGPSVSEHIGGISEFIRLERVTVIHSNFQHLDILDRFGDAQLICLAGDGVTRLPPRATRLSVSAFIVPEPPRVAESVPDGDATSIVQVAPFAVDEVVERLGPVSDIGPLALGLGAALALGATRISLVGFDGYEDATLAQQALVRETQLMLDTFRQRHPDLVISSLTPSEFDVPKASVYSRITELSQDRG